MEKSIVKRHNFDVALKNIEGLSKQVSTTVKFDLVEVSGGLFGWGDHKVTGTEMNNFINRLQTELIDANGNFTNLYRLLREIYNALNSLDKEYISGILVAVESAEKAIGEAKKNTEEINKTIEGLKKTVTVLSNFKKGTDDRLALLEEKLEKCILDSNRVTTAINNKYEILSNYENSFYELKEELNKKVLGINSKIDKYLSDSAATLLAVNIAIKTLKDKEEVLFDF